MNSTVIKTFNDLEFKPSRFNGERATVFFENGYGASIIRNIFSYGGDQGLYELALLKGESIKDFEICYTTEITDDVIGHLTTEKVSDLLEQIQKLERVK